MANASQQSLKELATTDARGFLQAFVERGNAAQAFAQYGQHYDIDYSLSPTELAELNAAYVVEGVGIKCVHSEGDCEGGGEHSEKVFAVLEGDQSLSYIRVTGYYASYNGTDWNDDWTFVEPRTVEVVQYFPKSA